MKTKTPGTCIAAVAAAAAALAFSLPAAAEPAAPAPANPPPPLVAASGPDNTMVFLTGMKGLTFSLPQSSNPSIGVAYLLSPTAALHIDLGIGFQFTGGSAYSFSLGLAYRGYIARVGRLYPFFQPSFVFGRLATPGVGTVAGSGGEFIGVGAGVGLEYFVLERITVGGVVGVNLNVGNIGGNGDAILSFTTDTSSLFATAYF